MKVIAIIFVGVLFSTLSYGESDTGIRTVSIKFINDSSFINSSTYFSFQTQCHISDVCSEVRVDRDGATEAQLEKIKKIFYLAQTLNKKVQYFTVLSDNRVDISKPITLLSD